MKCKHCEVTTNTEECNGCWELRTRIEHATPELLAKFVGTHAVRLNEQSFRALVRGGTVRVENAHIILADIGFDVIERAVADAGIDHYKDHKQEE